MKIIQILQVAPPNIHQAIRETLPKGNVSY